MTDTPNPADTNADDTDAPALDARDSDLDALCEQWVYWCRSRRLYWPAPAKAAAIARLGGGTRPLRAASDEPIPAASLAAFHIAYTCQPTSLEKQVFDLYYVARVKPIKAAAAALGIGRAHFYRVLIEFRRRLQSAASSFEENGYDARRLLTPSHDQSAAVNSESVSQSGDTLGN